jgi:hypothetical protein
MSEIDYQRGIIQFHSGVVTLSRVGFGGAMLGIPFVIAVSPG